MLLICSEFCESYVQFLINFYYTSVSFAVVAFHAFSGHNTVDLVCRFVLDLHEVFYETTKS